MSTKIDVPWHIWDHEVRLAVIRSGLPAEMVDLVSDEVTASGNRRIRLLYNTGETIESAVEMLRFLAEGRQRAQRGIDEVKFMCHMGRS